MRCLAVCHSELVIRLLAQVLPPSFDVDFVAESRPLAKRLHDAGLAITSGDPTKTDTFLKADVSPGTCVLVEDTGKPGLKRILQAVHDAGATLVYVLLTPVANADGTQPKRMDQLKGVFPELATLSVSELMGAPLTTELSRSLSISVRSGIPGPRRCS